MFWQEYTTHRLAVAEHQEQLRVAARNRLASLAVAARQSPGQAQDPGHSPAAGNLAERIRRFWAGPKRAAPAALKCHAPR